jgi:hypothetical protein
MVLYNIPTHVSGDTLNEIKFFLRYKTTNVPIDLTATSISMSICTYGTTTEVLEISTTNAGISITDATGGKFKIVTQTISLPEGRYSYDIVFTFPESVVKTYVRGTWRIIE